MSGPSEMYVGRQNGKLTEVFLGNRANAAALFDYMLERMPEAASDYAEEFEFGNWETLSITGLPARHFMPVYRIIMQAMEELPALNPYKDTMQTALQADPRYQSSPAMQAA